MKEQKDEKWLDELIADAIDSSKPQFDAEQWKEKYPEEFKMLVSRAGQISQISTSQPNVWRKIWKSPTTRLAAAAVIIVVVGFFAVHQGPDEQIAKLDISQVTESPAKMLTVMSLNNAFRRGGTEAVEEQCNQALEMLGLRPEKISIQELLADFNGG
ncbi:MAG: hypothetical protein ACYS9Y_09770 [Planctomycetota bacterium]|jgi:hypothetical protein